MAFSLGDSPSTTDRSPLQQHLIDDKTVSAQEQAMQQSQMETLLSDIAQIKEDQENMAVETGVSEGVSGVEMWNRIVRLEEDAEYFEKVTNRLEKYVEEMLRTMLGDLDRGRVLSCKISIPLAVAPSSTSCMKEQAICMLMIYSCCLCTWCWHSFSQLFHLPLLSQHT